MANTFNFKTKNQAFLCIGGAAILDFCNTKITHSHYVEERLMNIRQLQQFSWQVLGVRGTVRPEDFKNCLKLREKFHIFFCALIENAHLSKAFNDINKHIKDYTFYNSLNLPKDNKIQFKKIEIKKVAKKPSVAAILVKNYTEFISQMEVKRLKKCKNPNCSHLFYDESKNQTRNWCSMQSCGNILKARAFYSRKKNENSKIVEV